jgi:NTP pyrophosphatase (non-canonical NTP hydrolase)
LDSKTTVEALKRAVAEFRDARDWKKYHNPKDLAVSISIEANELLELFQWKDAQEVEALIHEPRKQHRIKEELADIVIYCLGACDSLEIDLSDAIRSKLALNAERYPVEKVKGSATKYSER